MDITLKVVYIRVLRGIYPIMSSPSFSGLFIATYNAGHKKYGKEFYNLSISVKGGKIRPG